MPDATELTKAIKKAASKAVKAEKPVEVCFGKVTSVDNFEFDLPQKGVIHVSFTAHTIFGDVQAERTVNF